MPLVFAYGSVMKKNEMKNTCPGAVNKGTAYFPRHRLVFSGSSRCWGCHGAANLIDDSGCDVWGVLWEIPEEDLIKLNKREGVCSRTYLPFEKEVITHEGSCTSAFIYLRPIKLEENAPREDYAQIILDGANENNLPAEYQDKLRRWIRDSGCTISSL